MSEEKLNKINPDDKIEMSLDDIIAVEGIKEGGRSRSRSRSVSQSRDRSRSRSQSRSRDHARSQSQNRGQRSRSQLRNNQQRDRSRSRSRGPGDFNRRNQSIQTPRHFYRSRSQSHDRQSNNCNGYGFESNLANGFRPNFRRESSMPASSFYHNRDRSRSRTPFLNNSRSRSRNRSVDTHNGNNPRNRSRSRSQGPINRNNFDNRSRSRSRGPENSHHGGNYGHQSRSGSRGRHFNSYNGDNYRNRNFNNNWQPYWNAGHTRPAPFKGNYYQRPNSRNQYEWQGGSGGSFRHGGRPYRGGPYRDGPYRGSPYRGRGYGYGYGQQPYFRNNNNYRGRGEGSSPQSNGDTTPILLSRQAQIFIAAEQRVRYDEDALTTVVKDEDFVAAKAEASYASRPTSVPTSERFKKYIAGFKEDVLNDQRSFGC